MITYVVNEGRLFGLTPSDWSVLLGTFTRTLFAVLVLAGAARDYLALSKMKCERNFVLSTRQVPRSSHTPSLRGLRGPIFHHGISPHFSETCDGPLLDFADTTTPGPRE